MDNTALDFRGSAPCKHGGGSIMLWGCLHCSKLQEVDPWMKNHPLNKLTAKCEGKQQQLTVACPASLLSGMP